jgi:hypothetical protein
MTRQPAETTAGTLRCFKEERGHEPPERKITITMHSIECDGAAPDSWLVRTDDGTEWHAATEADAAIELAAFIIGRNQAEQSLPELPEGVSWA